MYATLILNTWTFTCTSWPSLIILDASHLLQTPPTPLRLMWAVRPQLNAPLPLPWTFPRNWTKLAHQSHFLPQALHCLSSIDDAINTASTPNTTCYPTMITKEIPYTTSLIIFYLQDFATNTSLSTVLLVLLYSTPASIHHVESVPKHLHALTAHPTAILVQNINATNELFH